MITIFMLYRNSINTYLLLYILYDASITILEIVFDNCLKKIIFLKQTTIYIEGYCTEAVTETSIQSALSMAGHVTSFRLQ